MPSVFDGHVSTVSRASSTKRYVISASGNVVAAMVDSLPHEAVSYVSTIA
jgi:hypothetical protein